MSYIDLKNNIKKKYEREYNHRSLKKNDLQKSCAKDLKNQNLEKIIATNINMIYSIAKGYKNAGIDLEDLIGEGVIGLMHAYENYDDKFKMQFSTYAFWWIKNYITKYLNDLFGIKYSTKPNNKKIWQDRKIIEDNIQDIKNHSMLEKKYGMKIKTLKSKIIEHNITYSDNFNGGFENEDFHPWSFEDKFDIEISVDQKMIFNNRVNAIDAALSILSDVEKKVINMHKLDENPLSFRDIAKKLSLSHEQVRKIEKRALLKIKHHLTKHHSMELDFYYAYFLIFLSS